eukprot:5502900-Pyramimonas_sp.AAC.1
MGPHCKAVSAPSPSLAIGSEWALPGGLRRQHVETLAKADARPLRVEPLEQQPEALAELLAAQVRLGA